MSPRTGAAAIGLLLGLSVAPCRAAELELALHGGLTYPFYEQSFSFDPGPLRAGGFATIEQRSSFLLDARGGLALGAHAAIGLLGPLGIEARVDTADIDVRTRGATYNVRVDLPAPLPDLAEDVSLGAGTVDVDRVHPVSANVRLQLGRRGGVALSGGVSWLPRLDFTARQSVGVAGLPQLTGLEIARVEVAAQAVPREEGGRLGGNLGAAVRIPLRGRVSLEVEARGFLFPEHRLVWQRTDSGSIPFVDDVVIDGLAEKLEEVEFNPTFFQAVAGIVVRLGR